NFVFKEGWNSMSSFIIPENPAMEDLFASMVDELVIFRNLTEIYWPEENFNTIGDFNNQSGYVMKLTEDKNLQVVGSGNASRELVFENAGWYYAPVLSECPVLIEDLFGEQIANVVIIQELIGLGVYWPDLEIYSLQELTPGKAYSIKVSDAFTVEFPVCDLKSGVVNAESTNQVNTVWGSVKFSPYKQITAILTSAMIDLQAGDMIGAFDENDNLFGFTTITYLTTNTAISLFGSDQVTSAADGFMNGQDIKYKLFRESSGEEFNLEVSYSESLGNTSGKYQSNSMAAIKSVALKSGIETSEQFSFEVFPNPASSEVVLKLNTSETATATLNIFEVSGRLVMEGEIQKQTMLNVSELSPGVYYIKVWSQNNSDVKKLVIQ
ncbi:MAG: T9SS type A sorting domain-containing protein, partial [Bacteroidales bacterium]|nr:T9SS type A sorting domain-containing protein [Bacteroidales bacterium]